MPGHPARGQVQRHRRRLFDFDPEKLLHVYEDESGPTFELYVGADWEADRKRFRWGSVNERLNKTPRKSLKYSGGWSTSYDGYSYEKQRAPYLVPVGVGDYREYAPNQDGAVGEPTHLKTADVMNDMRDYLRDVVLPAIEACPVPQDDITFDLLAVPAEIPMPAGVGPLFAFAEYQDVRRIELAMKSIREPAKPASELEFWNEYKAPLADRYGLMPDLRLCALDVKNDGTMPEVVYDGFVWCGLGEVTMKLPSGTVVHKHERELEIPGGRKPYQSLFIVRVTPRRANGVYIADHGEYDKRRAELAKQIEAETPPRTRYNGAEVNDFMCARAGARSFRSPSTRAATQTPSCSSTASWISTRSRSSARTGPARGANATRRRSPTA